MICRTTFPTVAFVKENLSTSARWPTVLIRTTATNEYRPDIIGPLSLFTNIRGTSHAAINGRRLPLRDDCALVLPPGERFTLEYEHPVEVLNLHFADSWVADVASTLAARDGILPPNDAPALAMLQRLTVKSIGLGPHLSQLVSLLAQGTGALAIEEAMLELLATVLTTNQTEWQRAEHLSASSGRSTTCSRTQRARSAWMSWQKRRACPSFIFCAPSSS